VAQLGGIETKENFGAASHDGALERDDFGVRVGDAFRDQTFTAEKGGVEFPNAKRAHGIIAEEHRLAVQKSAAEHV
jgi:hypothetical protein